MENTTFGLVTSSTQISAWTAMEVVADSQQPPVQCPVRQQRTPRFPHMRQHLIGLLFAVTGATSGVQYVDYRREFRRTISSEILCAFRRKRGQPLSLREARQLALDILAASDKRLREERAIEARRLLASWDD